MGNLLREPSHLIVLLVVLVLLFGAKRLPDAARGIGRSMRILKAETKGMRDDDPVTEPVVQQTLPPVPLAPIAHQPTTQAAPQYSPPQFPPPTGPQA